eukprot:SAG31_NODE_6915_length_1850_cov_1.561073_2_plen_75_part_00
MVTVDEAEDVAAFADYEPPAGGVPDTQPPAAAAAPDAPAASVTPTPVRKCSRKCFSLPLSTHKIFSALTGLVHD